MKILVVFTGGTIGSLKSGEWISPSEITKYILIDDYIAAFGKDIVFDAVSPYYILSENLCADNLTVLSKCVNENLYKGYDGIIITHGTDTLQYSAAALSYTAKNAEIPILIVSSNLPLEDANSNGRINFEAAVSFIKNRAGNGVFVSYKNTDEEYVKFHSGTRLLSHGETTDNLYSIKNEPYATYEKGKIILNKNFSKTEKIEIFGNVVFCKHPNILTISSHPGDDFNYSLNDKKAVIIAPYHSGTINTDCKMFKEFCKRANEQNIPIFLVNQRDGFDYESKKLYDEMKIIKLPLCTFISAYIKAWIAISLSENLSSFMLKNLCGEFIL